MLSELPYTILTFVLLMAFCSALVGTLSCDMGDEDVYSGFSQQPITREQHRPWEVYLFQQPSALWMTVRKIPSYLDLPT